MHAGGPAGWVRLIRRVAFRTQNLQPSLNRFLHGKDGEDHRHDGGDYHGIAKRLIQDQRSLRTDAMQTDLDEHTLAGACVF